MTPQSNLLATSALRSMAPGISPGDISGGNDYHVRRSGGFIRRKGRLRDRNGKQARGSDPPSHPTSVGPHSGNGMAYLNRRSGIGGLMISMCPSRNAAATVLLSK